MPNDPIEHVVVLMLENHSFDQMLGALKSFNTDIDGVDPSSPGSNTDELGRTCPQNATTIDRITDDPKHEVEHVHVQLSGGMAGFVRDYEVAYPQSVPAERQQIMDYFSLGHLQALHPLAETFLICDRWFSSVPGPTWTNRFFVHSGTSKGRVRMPDGPADAAFAAEQFFFYDQDTIYDRLGARGISWKVYAGDLAQSLVLTHQWSRPKNAWGYCRMATFFSDAAGPAADFPQYSVIEPSYYMGGDTGQNDDHPPHSTRPAQLLVADVYNALRRNAALWNSTLLVVLYDEHGGFYDHVVPPVATPPDDYIAEYSFDQLGVRVPAILVSPWVNAGVTHTVFDHTSVLRYATDKWGLESLTRRVDSAESFAAAIRRTGSPRDDAPPSLHVDLPLMAAAPGVPLPLEIPLNEHQKAMALFAEFLSQQMPHAVRAAPPMAVAEEIAAAPSPTLQGNVAINQVDAFLSYQRMKGL